MCQEKEITKNVHKNIMNPINLYDTVDTIFMNSKTSGTYDPRSSLLNLTDKVNFKKVTNMLLYKTLAFTTHGKI